MSENATATLQWPWMIPATWSWTTLGASASVVGGGTPRTGDPRNWENGAIPWITPADLSGYTDKHIARGARSITSIGLTGSGARLLPEGTVLMSSRAPIGYVAVAANPLSTNQGFKSFVLGDSLSPDYVYWFLKGHTQLVLELASGTTFPEISGKNAARIPLPAAPEREQRRIVAAIEEHLSGLDVAIAGLERARRNLHRFRAAILDAAASGRLSESAPDVTDAAGLPPKWRLSTMNEILASIQAGKSFRCEERPPVTRETGLVKVSAVSWGVFDEDESKTIMDPERIDERFLIQPGDFLFSRANTIDLVGACVIVERITRRLLLSDKILRFTFTDVSPRWVLIFLRSRSGRKEIERLSTGNQESMRNIGQDRIRAIRIPLPPLEEQHRIVAEVDRRLATADRTAAEIDTQLARAARLRQSILARAFSGKLVPQDPSDEPASALLERIRATRATEPAPSRPRARRTARPGTGER